MNGRKEQEFYPFLRQSCCLASTRDLQFNFELEIRSQYHSLRSPPEAGVVPVLALHEVAVGASARVSDVTGCDSTSLRLLEMGLTPGVSVRVVGAAPLGDPLELELRGYRLSIRRNEAARVAIAE